MKSSSSASMSGRRSPARGHGAGHVRPVRGRDRVAGADVGAVHREGGDHLAQRVPQLAAGVVAVAAVTLADVGQQAGQALHLGGQLLAHDLELGGVHDLRVRLGRRR